MLEAITYQNMLRDINSDEIKEDTIGILITRPDLEVGKSILNSLNYFHHLSGNNTNFICLDMEHTGIKVIQTDK